MSAIGSYVYGVIDGTEHEPGIRFAQNTDPGLNLIKWRPSEWCTFISLPLIHALHFTQSYQLRKRAVFIHANRRRPTMLTWCTSSICDS